MQDDHLTRSASSSGENFSPLLVVLELLLPVTRGWRGTVASRNINYEDNLNHLPDTEILFNMLSELFLYYKTFTYYNESIKQGKQSVRCCLS